MKGLTPSRARVLSFLRSYIEAHGYSPSMREIAAGTGHVSTNGAKEMVEKLAREGYIIAPPKGTQRGIVLVEAEKPEFQGVERVELRNIRSALDGLLTHELNLAQFTQALTESFARCGMKQERTNVIRHGFQFADDDREKAGRVSPTLLRFLRSLENKEHRQ